MNNSRALLNLLLKPLVVLLLCAPLCAPLCAQFTRTASRIQTVNSDPTGEPCSVGEVRSYNGDIYKCQSGAYSSDLINNSSDPTAHGYKCQNSSPAVPPGANGVAWCDSSDSNRWKWTTSAGATWSIASRYTKCAAPATVDSTQAVNTVATVPLTLAAGDKVEAEMAYSHDVAQTVVPRFNIQYGSVSLLGGEVNGVAADTSGSVRATMLVTGGSAQRVSYGFFRDAQYYSAANSNASGTTAQAISGSVNLVFQLGFAAANGSETLTLLHYCVTVTPAQ